MMTVHYTGGTVLMADDVCEALIQYARVLAATQASDVLVVPVVEDGELATAEFLIGPASQLLAVPAAGVEEIGRDQKVIDDIESRTRQLDPPFAVSRNDEESQADFDHDSSS
jgi:hypothetical protein